MALINCPGCGHRISDKAKACPKCGHSIQNIEIGNASPNSNRKEKTIGSLLCVFAVLCIIWGIGCVTNDRYVYCCEHYEEGISGQAESMAEANNFQSGFFKSSYETIATLYEDMAHDTLMEIWKFRIEAIALCGVGAVSLIIGIQKFKKGSDG